MIQQKIEKAKILVEALPYIKRFHGKTAVIKYGGSVMFDQKLKEIFAADIALLKFVGIHPIIVHGGGKEISSWMQKLGKEPVFIDGLRVTDMETMEITEMVLSGKVNSEIVSLINRSGAKAVGLSGKDASLFTARKIRSKNNEDLGFVGEIETADVSLVQTLSERGYVPVISSVGESLEGETLNLNADYAAASVASALNALKLIYLTDVDGITVEGSLLSELDLQEAERLLNHPEIQGGMKPKLECCIRAIRDKVEHVHIINGKIEHPVLLELFTDVGIGTKLSYTKRGG
ncbi:MAG: acetylglutamate kinase [Bdellovibrionales bacterium]|nr:acetylglutamate kinase [Bdellovibrionales bacterium]